MDPLTFLAKITIVMILGLVVGLIAKRLRLPSMLLLIITGVILNNVLIDGAPVLQFSDDFLISATILALVMIIFKDSSNFSLNDLDTYSMTALKIAVLFLAINMIFLSVSTYYLFGQQSMIMSLLFAAVMSGTDPGVVLSLFHTKSNKITEILKFESVINTPLIVLIPFIMLDLMELGTDIFVNFVDQFLPFLQQIITGIGTGVVIGLIVFRFMRRFYSEKFSPLTIISAALLTYILSENLGGNGVLAVTVLGIFFGNVTVKKKGELQEFSSMLSNVLEILVFILIGFLVPLKLDFVFLLKSILLFVIMILLRFAAIQLVCMQDHINIKERIFMALNCTKGIAVAVVAFILSNYVLKIPIIQNGMRTINNVPLMSLNGSDTVISLMVLFILYSILLSSIAARFSQKFIRLKVEEG